MTFYRLGVKAKLKESNSFLVSPVNKNYCMVVDSAFGRVQSSENSKRTILLFLTIWTIGSNITTYRKSLGNKIKYQDLSENRKTKGSKYSNLKAMGYSTYNSNSKGAIKGIRGSKIIDSRLFNIK